jgi:hypothetical protein
MKLHTQDTDALTGNNLVKHDQDSADCDFQAYSTNWDLQIQLGIALARCSATAYRCFASPYESWKKAPRSPLAPGS